MKLSADSSELFSDLTNGTISIDCGAHVGNVTEKMAEKGALVYAFEPNPIAFEKLKNRFLNYSNVICFNQAVWHKNDKIFLYFEKGASQYPIENCVGSSIISYNPYIDQKDSIEIEAVDFTEFLNKIGKKIKLVKLDIEGAEFDVLKKMIDLNLHENIETIVVETHEWLIPEMKSAAENLKELIRERNITNIFLNWI
ncbi:FkbM family methyltransferase [Peribacillus sp. NPDC096448]|uniref:FkbM family methyltransferase n=1 Tax=Peribacillus sp. NPDC096448 TaxID=3364395 RepID=UPI00382F310E